MVGSSKGASVRYRGREYRAKGVKIAIIDSGININDSRLEGVKIEG